MAEEKSWKDVRCDDIKEIKNVVNNHEKRITSLEKDHAVINVKLNAILWVLSAIGVAVIGAIVKLVL